MKKPILVYIIGPYTKGDVVVNVRRAIQAGDRIAQMGAYPFIPHLSHGWHMVCPHEYSFWLDQDLIWLDICDASFRVDGESDGGDTEEARHRAQGKPVFYDFDVIQAWIDEQKEGM